MPDHAFKLMLRNAVIAAIPLSTQVGCVTTETQPPLPKLDDPCRTGEVTRQSAQERFAIQQPPQTAALSAEQCLALCKQLFESTRIGPANDLFRLEKLAAQDCKTEQRPFSEIVGGRQSPTPSTLVSCEVSYTALHSPYTCPRPVPGRAPHGLQVDKAEVNGIHDIGDYLADMAAMELAAVTAFHYLSRELAAYQAPAALVARALAAAAEEVRHAQMAEYLSAAAATTVPTVTVEDFVLRPLYDIALANAVEGCVNETFAAACGVWQGQQAEWAVFRRVIEHISDEELGHAALSWDIHEWLMPQLTAAQQHQIRLAQADAVARLLREFDQSGQPALQHPLGLPDRAAAARLFAQLQGSVWAKLSA